MSLLLMQTNRECKLFELSGTRRKWKWNDRWQSVRPKKCLVVIGFYSLWREWMLIYTSTIRNISKHMLNRNAHIKTDSDSFIISSVNLVNLKIVQFLIGTFYFRLTHLWIFAYCLMHSSSLHSKTIAFSSSNSGFTWSKLWQSKSHWIVMKEKQARSRNCWLI